MGSLDEAKVFALSELLQHACATARGMPYMKHGEAAKILGLFNWSACSLSTLESIDAYALVVALVGVCFQKERLNPRIRWAVVPPFLGQSVVYASYSESLSLCVSAETLARATRRKIACLCAALPRCQCCCANVRPA